MFCSNCGCKLDDDAKFCPECGTAVEENATEAVVEEKAAEVVEETSTTEEEGETAETSEEEKTEEKDTAKEETSEPVVEETIEEEKTVEEKPVEDITVEEIPVSDNVEEEAPAQKKSVKKIVGIIVGVVVVVALLIAAYVFLVPKGEKKTSTTKHLVYLDGDTLYYINDFTKKKVEPREIYDLDSYANVQFSDDHKYLYFTDGEDGENDLYRIAVSKISKDYSKNKKNLEKVVSDVDDYFLLDNGDVVYYTDDEICYYNGKDDNVLVDADDVDDLEATEDEKNLYYLVEDDEEDDITTYELFSCQIAAKSSEKSIDSDVYEMIATFESNKIAYFKNYDEDTHSATLCVADVKGDVTEVADSVSVYNYEMTKDAIYYTVAKEGEATLYNFVKDPYAASDEGVQVPKKDDYVKSIESSAINSIYNSGYSFYSRDIAESVLENEDDYSYNSTMEDTGIYAYSGNYIFYKNGKDYYYNYNEAQWYEYDYNAYNDATRDNQEVIKRVELRERLQNTEISTKSYDLFCYKNEKSKAIAEDVATIKRAHDNIVLFTKADMSKADTYDFDELLENPYKIGYASDVDIESKETYYSINGGEVQELDEKELNGFYVSSDGKKVVVAGKYNESGYELTAYTVSDDKLKNSERITKKGEGYYFMGDGNFIFADNIKKGKCDICSWNGKEAKVIAEKVSGEGRIPVIFDNGAVGYADSGELNVFDKNGQGERIDKKVEEYTARSIKSILYLKKDTLYYYNGKESNELADDVDTYWVD